MVDSIEQLNIEIGANIKKNSAKNIDALAQSLLRLEATIPKDIESFSNITKQLSSISNIKDLSNASKGINRLSKSLNNLKGISFAGFSNKIGTIVNGLAPLKTLELGNLGKSVSGINSFVRGLFKLKEIDTKKLSVDMVSITKAVKPLTNEFLRGGANARAYADSLMAINKINPKIDKGNKKINSSFSGISSSIAKASVTFISFRKLVGFIRGAVEESSNLVENMNLFAVTFGESNYRESLEWATDLAKQFGFANNQIIKMTGLYKQLASSLNIVGDRGTKLSKIATKLTLDFSSFFNKSIEQMQNALTSGLFAGQTKTMRQQLGIDISYQSLDNLIKLTPEIAKFGKTTRMMTQDQKVMLRLFQTLSVGTNAFGDMGATINTLANNFRVLKGSVENLKLAFGDAFLSEPIQKFAEWGIIATNVITNLIRILFPMQKELERTMPNENLFTSIEEDAESANKAIGKLSFDYFNALGSGEENALAQDVALNETLNKLLEEQYNKYEDISNSVLQVNKSIEKANELTEKISKFLFVLDEDGAFIGFSNNFKKLANNIKLVSASLIGLKFGLLSTNPILGAMAGILSFGIIQNEDFRESIVSLIKNLSSLLPPFYSILDSVFNIVQKFLKILMPILNVILKITAGILDFITKAGLVEPLLWTLIGVIAVLQAKKFADMIGDWVIKSIDFSKGLDKMVGSKSWTNLWKSLDTTKAKFIGASIGIGLIIYGITNLVRDFDKMSGFEKFANIFLIVAGAAFVLSTAIMGLQSAWTLGIGAAAIVAGITTMLVAQKRAAEEAKKIQQDIQYKADGGTFDLRGGTALGVVNERENELVYSNNSKQIEVANQQSLQTNFENAMLKILPQVLADYCKSTKIVIEDKSSFAEFTRKATPSIMSEAKRIGRI